MASAYAFKGLAPDGEIPDRVDEKAHREDMCVEMQHKVIKGEESADAKDQSNGDAICHVMLLSACQKREWGRAGARP